MRALFANAQGRVLITVAFSEYCNFYNETS